MVHGLSTAARGHSSRTSTANSRTEKCKLPKLAADTVSPTETLPSGHRQQFFAKLFEHRNYLLPAHTGNAQRDVGELASVTREFPDSERRGRFRVACDRVPRVCAGPGR